MLASFLIFILSVYSTEPIYSLSLSQTVTRIRPFPHIHSCALRRTTRCFSPQHLNSALINKHRDIHDKSILILNDIVLKETTSEYCDDVDSVLRFLVSPAPESFYVIDASMQRLGDAISNANETIQEVIMDIEALSKILVKPGFRVEVNNIFNDEGEMKNSAQLKWMVIPNKDAQDSGEESQLNNYVCNYQEYHNLTTLELAHDALKIATMASSKNQQLDRETVRMITRQAEKRLTITMGSDIRGRKSADAAFTFALAGITSPVVFNCLWGMTRYEMKRLECRATFKSKHILQMIEKIACSGISGPIAHYVFQTAGICLQKKKYEDEILIDQLLNGHFGLHSERPLLWLWRYSRKQKKPSTVVDGLPFCENLDRSQSYTDPDGWGTIFEDPTKDLVVDIGCGMGVSLLGLDSLRSPENTKLVNSDLLNIDWASCNFVGADLNPLMTQYANGIASRWRCRNVQFLNIPAEDFLLRLSSYPGKIKLIMINFPSPYQLGTHTGGNTSRNGNSQLPTASDGFMVTKSVLMLSSLVLSKDGGDGKLLLQTKCEDVAVHMKNLALKTGNFKCVQALLPVLNIDDGYQHNGRVPQRVTRWLDLTPTALERAEGLIWSSKSLLPKIGQTETEVACKTDGSFIHRCLLTTVVTKRVTPIR